MRSNVNIWFPFDYASYYSVQFFVWTWQIPSIHICQHAIQILGIIVALLDDVDESVQLTAVSCLLMVIHPLFYSLMLYFLKSVLSCSTLMISPSRNIMNHTQRHSCNWIQHSDNFHHVSDHDFYVCDINIFPIHFCCSLLAFSPFGCLRFLNHHPMMQ